MLYRRNPNLRSSRDLLAYDLEHDPGRSTNGAALFPTSKKLIVVYLEGIVHIIVSPKVLTKTSQENVEAHILGIIMVQQFSLLAGIKKFGNQATVSISKELH